ncbi:hypothetical protein BS47DRAFT_647802 [Hydnum rufescens UP504]|uniref:Xylanolytic transcriptional activator regulatory domain-containing protein n=1 Tax=Hydnum rufescens UP504 TaxID=1448309 RepID=A0A9P6BA77_9AGAM|nr:hypothetical protein BS47DRAFT_647802 [Hydnum rufescens UP504]
MMDSEYRALRPRIGDPLLDSTDRFYIPPGLFSGCYTVPHWLLPPLQRLSVFAANTFRHILGHLGIIHEPTFRLADVHAWVAFALCTAGGNRPYRTQNAEIEDEPWDAVQSIVRTEKTGMFVRLFSQPVKVRAKEALAGIHALLIYNSHSFLSDDPSERAVGELFLNTIAKIARRVGLFDPHADFVNNDYNPYDDVESEWQRWIRREGCRRTSWLIYFLETVAAFENMRPPLVGACDVKHLPIPAAHSAWKATTSRAWASFMPPPPAMPFTLDSVMDKLFDFSVTAADGSPAPPCFLDVYELGPFARLVMIVTLTRGIVEFGEGKQMGGYLVSRWILGERGAGDDRLQYDATSPAFSLQIIDILHKALGRWKIGWDYDMACELEHSRRETRDHRPQHPQPETKYFIHDAMPFWWMSHLLLSHLSTVIDHQSNAPSAFYVGITPITDVHDSHEPGRRSQPIPWGRSGEYVSCGERDCGVCRSIEPTVFICFRDMVFLFLFLFLSCLFACIQT